MADIFISYKREERDRARLIADAVESSGWSIWWDPKLQAGERFDDAIQQAIDSASCVIVVWSQLAVASTYVKDEASYALKRGKLVPVSLDDWEPPFRFQGLHTISLRGWDGSAFDPAFRELERHIEAKAGRRSAAASERILDLLKSPEPSSVSAAEIGLDPRELMELHVHMLTRDSRLAARLSARSPSDLLFPESTLGSAGPLGSFGFASLDRVYGRMTRTELSDFTQFTFFDPTMPPRERKACNRKLELARKALAGIESKGKAAVDYMPAQLKDLPAHLKRRAIAILLDDPLAGASIGSGRPFAITPEQLGQYRLLHRSPEVVHDVERIADHLHWRLA